MIDIEKYFHKKFALVSDLIGLLYNLKECSCGGLCHLVTDDNNLYDDCLDTVINECNENTDRVESGLCKLICESLKEMTFDQRAMLFYLIDYEYEYLIDSDYEIINNILSNSDIQLMYEEYDYRNEFH